MPRGRDAVWQLASRKRPQSTTLCSSCLSAQRHNSTAAFPVETAPTEQSPTDCAPASPLTASSSHSLIYKIKASVLLSRPPLLLRDLTPFEKAYFLYQKRLNERLALPFSRYFYYQKGTTGDVEWKRKMRSRKTAARDIGNYSGYGEESWNDEVVVGDTTSEPAAQVESLIRDAEGREGDAADIEEMERPPSRTTEADERSDKRSLNRMLARTLYLLVKTGEEKAKWKFPANELLRDESLHTAAERIIVQSGGINMNTWVVGNMPVGHLVYNYSKPLVDPKSGPATLGQKTFYMKARIMGGQAQLKDNKFNLAEYQWLAKEEIQDVVEAYDWNSVKNILVDR